MKLVRSNQVTPSAVRRVIVAAAAVLFSVTLAPALTTQARAEAGARDEAGRRTTSSARSAAAERRAERVVRGRDAERPLRSSTSRVIKARRSGGVEDVATGWPRARPLAASRVPRPRVSPALRSLAGSARSGGVSTRAGLRAGMPGETARIELAALPGRAEELLLRVDAMGGTRLASSGSVVRADVPVASIDELLTSGVVRAARLAREGARTRTRGDGKAPQPAKTGAVLSDGVGLSGADTWLSTDTAPFGLERSAPVRVAILDLGFEGFDGLIGSELAPDTTTRDFAPDWDIEGCFGGVPPCIPDGTAMAEIVQDMAPAADLVLIAVDPDDFAGSVEPAIDFITGGDGGAPTADLLVSGLTWQPGLQGDGYGAGPLATFADELAAAGVTWISDVGDRDLLGLQLYGFVPAEAGHWHGGFADTVDHFFGGAFDSDGYMDTWFEDDNPQAGETWLNRFCLGAGDEIFLDLVWDDWDDSDDDFMPAPTEDYSIDVYEDLGGGSIDLFDSSVFFLDNEQNGTEGQFPWDFLDFENSAAEPVCFFLTVFAENATGGNRFHLYWAADSVATPGSVSTDFSPPSSLAEGNRLIPADSASVVSVAATTVGDSVEPFTLFGLPEETVPQVCAPDDVSTVSLGGGFLSSFAAAHVGGAAALLMHKVSTLDASDAIVIVGARARDILGAATDPRCGSGRICLLTDGCPAGD